MACLALRFEPALASSADEARLSRCRAVVGEALSLIEKEQDREALDLLESIAPEYTELSGYVLLQRLRLLHRTEHHHRLVRLFYHNRDSLRGAVEEPQALLYGAYSLLRQGRYSKAAALYEEMRKRFPKVRSDLVRMRLANAYREMGRLRKAERCYQEVVWFYPASGYAKQALREVRSMRADNEMRMREPGPEALLRTLRVHKQKGSSTNATLYCRKFLRLYPRSAGAGEVRLILAELLLGAGKKSNALETLGKLKTPGGPDDDLGARAALLKARIKRDPEDEAGWRAGMLEVARRYPRTPTAAGLVWRTARSLFDEQDYAAAAAVFSRLPGEHPADTRAGDAAWMEGWCLYLSGDAKRALRIFQRIVQSGSPADHVPAAVYWSARIHRKNGDHQRADALLRGLTGGDRFSYYGMAATYRLMENDPANAVARGAGIRMDRRSPISGTDALAALTAEAGPSADRLVRIREYLALHLDQEARRELDRVEINGELMRLTHLAVLYAEAGEPLGSIRLANRAMEVCLESGLAPPPGLDRLRMPLRYPDQIRRHAGEQDLDPYFVMGLIRQESAFQPGARSISDARGLMQVIPDTGRFIAAKKGIRRFAASRLFDPEVSLSFGSWYLRHLLDRFNQDLVAATSSYNAGPNRLRQWMPRFADLTADEAIETIPFDQTRDYVKLVLRNYEIYRRLYGDPAHEPGDMVFSLLARPLAAASRETDEGGD